MICLCIETTTARVGAALTQDGRLLTEVLLDAPGGLQNRLLMAEIQRLLSNSGLTIKQIDLFACAAGPGAFTGVRTGIAAIQGLALAANKPCVAISTLAMLSMNLPYCSLQVCPMLDARKNEVYTALYRVASQPETVIADCVSTPVDFVSVLTGPTIFLGDGALRYREQIQKTLGNNAFFAPLTCTTPRPAAGCLLAETAHNKGNSVTPEHLLPTYLRLSEAELLRQKKII